MNNMLKGPVLTPTDFGVELALGGGDSEYHDYIDNEYNGDIFAD